MRNLYQLLGVSNRASFKDIWKAIHSAAQSQRLPLRVLQEAKAKLMNPNERQRYDAELSAFQSANQGVANNKGSNKQSIIIKNNSMTINYDASLWEALPIDLKRLMPQFQKLSFNFKSEVEKQIYQSILKILTSNRFDVSFCRMCHYGRDRFVSLNCYFPVLLFYARDNIIQVYSNRTIEYYRKLGISAEKPHSQYVNWRTLVNLDSVEQLIAVFQNEIIFSYQRAATAFNLMSLDFSEEQEDYIAAYLSKPEAWVYYKHYRGVFKRADEFLFLSGINLKDD